MGFYINRLHQIKAYIDRRGIGTLTKTQRRLITKELEKTYAFEDTYWTTGTQQKRIFIDIVKRYTNLTNGLVESFF